MLHPRDPGGERLTGKRGGREQRRRGGGRGTRRDPPAAACCRPAPRHQTPAKRRCCPRPAAGRGPAPAPALRRAAGPTPHRSAAPARRRGGAGPCKAPRLAANGTARGGGDMQSAAPGGQWGGALRRAAPPPLASAGRGAVARRTAPRSQGREGARSCPALRPPLRLRCPRPRRVPVPVPPAPPGAAAPCQLRGAPARAAACAQAGPRGPVPKPGDFACCKMKQRPSGTAGSRVRGGARGGVRPTLSPRPRAVPPGWEQQGVTPVSVAPTATVPRARKPRAGSSSRWFFTPVVSCCCSQQTKGSTGTHTESMRQSRSFETEQKLPRKNTRHHSGRAISK